VSPAAKNLDKEGSSGYGIVCIILEKPFHGSVVSPQQQRKIECFKNHYFYRQRFSLLSFCGVRLWGPADFGRAADTGPKDMELKSPSGKRTARFPHRKHQELNHCRECHHGSKEGKITPYRENMQVRGSTALNSLPTVCARRVTRK
jgi:hypothetical protein